ncbi:peptidase [Campylobacterota bacterium]|nr:peptidase [Campylobacterota bacterium]
MRYLIWLFFAICLFATGDASYPGGVAIVPLGEFGKSAPIAHLGGARVRVERLDGEWTAIVGVAIDTKEGSTQTIVYETADGKRMEAKFAVGKKSYPTQKLKVDDRFVELNASTLERAQSEQQEMRSALAVFGDRHSQLRMRLPLVAPISGYFGSRRVFNGKPKRPHSGMDLAAPKGTTIAAPQDGSVALAKNLYFCGNSVLIDHGEGLFTLFCHMDTIAVSKGSEVLAGDELGSVGSTGRVTAAHLHWSVGLNGAWIDPLLLLDANETRAIQTVRNR